MSHGATVRRLENAMEEKLPSSDGGSPREVRYEGNTKESMSILSQVSRSPRDRTPFSTSNVSLAKRESNSAIGLSKA